MNKYINIFISLIFSIGFSFSANALFKRDNNQIYYNKFKEVFEKIEKDYVKEPKKQELLDAAIEGMLSSLDPHSYYYSDEDLESFKDATIGEFGGIGVEIIYETGAIKVISPIDDLGAYKAGVKAGDYIVRVNDDYVNSIGFNKSIQELRGKPGTKVKVTVIREGEGKPLEFEITREIVKVDSVKTRSENNVAYVRVSTFSEKAAKDLKKEVNKLFNSKNKPEGIILDLRNNPGGLLDVGIEMADYFIKDGTIVSMKGRDISSEMTFVASSNTPKIPNVPIVVLINNGSASASEILAGALKDHKRAILVGTKTYGKGSVQTFFPFDSRSAIKFTTGIYYTPNGTSIQAEGIEPDIEIEYAKVEYPKKSKDYTRFSEASLKNHLENEKSKNSKKTTEESKDAKSKDEDIKKCSDEYKNDFQYARAYDIIQGLIISVKNDESKK